VPEPERDEIPPARCSRCEPVRFRRDAGGNQDGRGIRMCPVPCEYLRRARLRWRDPSPGPGRHHHSTSSPEGRAPSRRAQLQEPAAPGREPVGETCQRQGRGTWTLPHSDPHLHFTM
jgi:hypothetical protein